MKTILFLASELKPRKAQPARCNELYKIIDKHLSLHKAKTYFTLFKWDQPSSEEALEKIEEHPAYIHYCGHGDESGDLQLIANDNEVKSLPRSKLIDRLKENHNLECVFLGSCNSDKLVEELKLHAEYSIGFTKSPSAEFVLKFYNEFYAELTKHGSPFKAYLVAIDQLSTGKLKTAGARAILRSKHNYIMELLERYEQSNSLRSNLAGIDSSMSGMLNKLASLEGEARSVFQQLLLISPFADDVFWFHSLKEKLAHDIALQIMEGEEEDEIEFFEERLFMAFEVLEKVLVAYEEKEMVKHTLEKIGNGVSGVRFEMAFKKLEKNSAFKSRSQGFRDLLSGSIKFCVSALTKA